MNKKDSGGLLSLEELEQLVDRGEIDTVIVAFSDHYGQLMGKRLKAEYFLNNRLKHECCDYLLTVDIDMTPQPGFSSSGWNKGFGNYHLNIDFSTLRRIDWPSTTALVLGDPRTSGGGEVSHNPRTVLKTQYNLAISKGFLPMMASELEFYLFKGGSSPEIPLPSSDRPLDYHIGLTQPDEPLMRELRNRLNHSGLTIESSKGETGKGQYEIALAYDNALEMADRHILFKHGVKAIAGEMGYSATFMAKYSADDSGSSGHIHLSLTNPDNRRNLFGNKQGDSLNSNFSHFLGGLMSKTAELFLFFAPTINSYKRFSMASFAPTSLSWGYDNRTAAFRVVGQGESLRLENRLPGADMNPYTAYAAMLAAGISGIEQGIAPPEEVSGNAYRDEKFPQIPSSLEEAAGLLDRSDFARSLFGDEVVDFYVHHARLECRAFGTAVTDWERHRYFSRI